MPNLMRKYITFPFLWNLGWYFPLLLERKKFEDVTQHLERGPPFPDAQTWRKRLNVFSMKQKPLESSRSAHILWKLCFGSFVVWLWTFLSLRETCKGARSRREKWVKRKDFFIPVWQIVHPLGFCFALTFTWALIYHQVTPDLFSF